MDAGRTDGQGGLVVGRLGLDPDLKPPFATGVVIQRRDPIRSRSNSGVVLPLGEGEILYGALSDVADFFNCLGLFEGLS